MQFPKTGGSWTNRVKVRIAQSPAWLTVPIRRDYHGVRRVSEMQIDNSKPWRARVRKTLEANYRRTAHFQPTMALVDDVLSYEGESLCELNVRGLHRTLDHLGWDHRTLISSASLGLQETGTDLLVAIARTVNAGTYLSGDGAEGYQQRDPFDASGVTLTFQNFEHPVYPQTGAPDFQRGLSIVDALFEVGAPATARLLEAR